MIFHIDLLLQMNSKRFILILYPQAWNSDWESPQEPESPETSCRCWASPGHRHEAAKVSRRIWFRCSVLLQSNFFRHLQGLQKLGFRSYSVTKFRLKVEQTHSATCKFFFELYIESLLKGSLKPIKVDFRNKRWSWELRLACVCKGGGANTKRVEVPDNTK